MYQPRLNNFELPVDEYACPDGQGLPVVAYDNYTDNTCVIHSKTRGNAGKDEDADINSEQKETIEEQISKTSSHGAPILIYESLSLKNYLKAIQ
jgi:hypothetical protein